ncbi:MAG: hypothetical protein M3238_04720 [Actinomycetota bacterium]|nr:hypothetical protein [Actinomycetota bacterium]
MLALVAAEEAPVSTTTSWSRRRLVPVTLCFIVASFVPAGIAGAAESDSPDSRNDVVIRSDDDLDAAHGVRSGSGTASDPYVISGWRMRNLYIADTSKHLVIRDNAITGRLTLNWNGPGVTVVDNTVGDLRVNQNVRRTGAATGGWIARNTFGIVGQLRHFDGVFEYNTVRPRNSLFGPLWGIEAVQFDGFHGAHFRHNTLYGFLDVKLHGHHHGSSFGSPSHHHSEGTHGDHDAEDVDHSSRFHEVFVHDNTIYSDGPFALRYTDTNHRGDDRTAASESNPELNKPHVHHTRVHLVDNKLIGSGLYVDVFNAPDQNHTATDTGLVEIRRNVVTLDKDLTRAVWDGLAGIEIWNVKDVRVTVKDNVVTSKLERDTVSDAWVRGAGILLHAFDAAQVRIADNSVSNLRYGVRASRFSSSVYWWVTGLETDSVDQPVYYDSSVANPPRREP